MDIEKANALEIIKKLNYKKQLEIAREIIYCQGIMHDNFDLVETSEKIETITEEI